MKNDSSKIFFDIYLNSNKSLLEVTLKTGRRLTGVIISFIFGDSDKNETFIKAWYFVEEKYKLTLGINAAGLPIGELINQNDIMTIKFIDDIL